MKFEDYGVETIGKDVIRFPFVFKRQNCQRGKVGREIYQMWNKGNFMISILNFLIVLTIKYH